MATSPLQTIDGSELRFVLSGEQETPRALVLMLHGSGSHGGNLAPLAERLARMLPGTLFVMPNAPQSYGELFSPLRRTITKWLLPEIKWDESRTWAAPGRLSGDNQERRRQLLDELRRPIAALNRLVDLLLARYGLSDAALGIYGFSQGGMIAVYLGLQRATPCAAMICHSGQFYGGGDVSARPPALVIVGSKELEPPHPQVHIFPFTVRKLRELSVPVDEMVSEGLGHGTNAAVVERCSRFLSDRLGLVGPAAPGPASPGRGDRSSAP